MVRLGRMLGKGEQVREIMYEDITMKTKDMPGRRGLKESLCWGATNWKCCRLWNSMNGGWECGNGGNLRMVAVRYKWLNTENSGILAMVQLKILEVWVILYQKM